MKKSERRRTSADDPARKLVAIGKAISRIESGHRKALHQETVELYKESLVLKSDPDRWLRLVRSPEWEGRKRRPQETDQNRALNFAIELAFPGTKERRNRSDLRGALTPSFDDGVPPEIFAKSLREQGGLAGLRKKSRSGNRDAGGGPVSPVLLEFTRGPWSTPLAVEAGLKWSIDVGVREIRRGKVVCQLLRKRRLP